MVKSIYEKILDVLFPVKCLGCGTTKTIFCDDCVEERVRVQSSQNPEVVSVLNYKDKVVKEAIWNLKYTGNKKIGGILAQTLYDKILEEISEEKIFSNFTQPILVPIPLSKERFRKRGFNQSELIAKNMAILDEDRSFIFMPNVLYKIKDTTSQAKIKDREKRLKNLNGCFAVKDISVVRGRNIILIDDITTTGATISEAIKTLKHAGARKVIAFTVAH